MAEIQSARPLQQEVDLPARIADLSTAGSTFVPSTVRGNLVKVYATLQGTIDADTVLTVSIATVNIATITLVAAGSVAGTTFEVIVNQLLAANHVNPGTAVEFETDGATTSAIAAEIRYVTRQRG